MGIDQCFQLGNIIKTHGLKGDVVASIDSDNPEYYNDLESVFLLKNTLIPFFISDISIQGNKAKIRFEDYDSIEKSNELIGLEIYLPLSMLPEIQDVGFYYHDLIGCEAFDNGKAIGIIKEIFQPSHQFLASIEHAGEEILVPITDEIVADVNLSEKRVDFNLPDGLLEIYKET
jgi:16S rRNA processing protein RimM